MSAVLASGADVGGDVSSSEPLSGGANTVAGSETERSSPASALVSVPAHGVAPTGAAGADDPPEPGPAGTPACVSGSPLPDTPPCVRGSEGSPPGATPDEPEPEPAPAPARTPDPGAEAASPFPEPAAEPEPAPEPASRRSAIPSLSAASCNHSGGDNKNDV